MQQARQAQQLERHGGAAASIARDRVAERFDRLPLRLGAGLGHARRFVNAGHVHLVAEVAFAFIHPTGDRRGARRIGRTGEGDMALARKQAARGIQPDPAGAGQVDFAPSMQVGEVARRAARAVERFDVGGELDQVAADEACGEPEVAE